jgi:glycosyltransferase involved in cell wall biosynthesis
MEGLGSAALMAMSAGVPVVASAVGGLCEVVEHERTGLLTENTVERIAAAMRRMVDQGDFAAKCGARGRARFLERFTLARMVAGTAATYAKAAECSKR